jgi:L-lactate dehydrogenase complex protein LldG
MSRARDDILAGIRTRLGVSARSPTDALAAERARLLPPAFVRTAPDLAVLFMEKLKTTAAGISLLPSVAGLPQHIAELLHERGLPPVLHLAEEPVLRALGWQGAGIQLRDGLELMRSGTVVSGGAAGVAETGSLLITTAGPTQPEHNLFAELHVVVIERSRIVATIEDAWCVATAAGVPRGILFVSGPSRTGDIEMTLELGVHGALAVHVVLIGPERVNEFMPSHSGTP